ncbi:MAG: DUF1553 domain-containing protein [Verrucomicrobiota bacterium]|nr:DUF1553 domain-containing protein [Verrucomicrobiota bacterium]
MYRPKKLCLPCICLHYFILAVTIFIFAEATCISDDKAEKKTVDRFDIWSLHSITKEPPPKLNQTDRLWAKNSIDHFVAAKLAEKKLTPSKEADRATLIRRVYFDILGLPPNPDEIQKFSSDNHPLAYERLIEQLLASPRYGERWARHWLDIVHYGDTHGYDKDKLRPNSWPYRDYVIRSFNGDKPYNRFVHEQIAGDALFPDTQDGIEGTGFISAGPWDFIGHAEVPETKLDGRIARNIDRDDMVKNTMNTFISTTVQCARCHDHKFDEVKMTDYYRMQAVFSALDRADQEYYPDPKVAQKHTILKKQIANQKAILERIELKIQSKGGEKLKILKTRLKELYKQANTKIRQEFGYHSKIEAKQKTIKWVQVDLGESKEIGQVTLIGASDSYNNIGDGFGFPIRYKIEASDDVKFRKNITLIADLSLIDQPNPGIKPQHFNSPKTKSRYVRLTANKLAKRSNDFILAMGEMQIQNAAGENLAIGKDVTSLDSIEAPVRWQKKNLVDDIYNGRTENLHLAKLISNTETEHSLLINSIVTEEISLKRKKAQISLGKAEANMKLLPKPQKVYVGKVHTGSGAFRGTGNEEGKPRTIRVLHRGDMSQPREEVGPGTLRLAKRDSGMFKLPSKHSESDRRIALAHWITQKEHPLTWRSIVNRIWQYHFGIGIVSTPNDFGRMGAKPTHPKLLDWLAAEFRDNGQSIKKIHKLILTSATYRQASTSLPDHEKIDSQNRYLWRMNRRQLEAEALRDSILFLSGKMNFQMYGPGFRNFILEHPEHSPHYEYHKHNPEDTLVHRRSIYRFLVRSQQQPFMATLNCADPSQQVAKRNESITALQSLALLNNKLIVAMAKHFSNDISHSEKDLQTSVNKAFFRSIGRIPTAEESADLIEFTKLHGLSNTCRLLFNLNAFSFID